MKNTRHFAKLLALALSLLLLLGALPAFADAAEERDILVELEAANHVEKIFQRHTTLSRHEDIYFQGELVFGDDMYTTAETDYYFYGQDDIAFNTPTSKICHWPDGRVVMVLMTPEDYASEFAFYHTSYLFFDDSEVLQAVEEQDGEMLITTRISDPDAVRAVFDNREEVFIDYVENEYSDGMEVVYEYLADVASLELKEMRGTVVLPDGSELPIIDTSFVYDAEIPDPTAPDSPLTPAFDETGATRQITVVFASGTPEEETCVFTLPEGVGGFASYHGEYVQFYVDAACTTPFTGGDGKSDLTLYTKGED